MQITLKHYRPETWKKVEKNYPAVMSYMKKVFNTNAFKESKYSSDTVVWGWDNARKAKKEGGKACAV